ncbi:Tex family protein [Candidatus Omnitrophota bacterium]
MEHDFTQQLSQELNLSKHQITAVTDLLNDGSTIPFISRYRKEATGNLDEVEIGAIRDRLNQLRELEKRREAILKSIHEQGKLTDKLKAKILAAETLAVLEDIYLPFKPKRRTRATVAKEKGLEPLAQLIFEQKGIEFDALQDAAKQYVNAELKVESIDAALAGARDIIAEWINEDGETRARLRDLYRDKGIIGTKVVKKKEAEAIKFKDYYDWSEHALNCPSHRILAARRGEKEGFLALRIVIDAAEAESIMERLFLKVGREDTHQVKLAVADSFKRLLSHSLEAEYRLELKKRADAEAIDIFKNNMRELLMASPMGQKKMMAIDPGFRTGCKVVCLDAQGQLLINDTIYLIDSEAKRARAIEIIKDLCAKYDIEVIAIGNGTASRETDAFVKSIGLPKSITVVMVSESGASVYSASDVAREEFPDYDVTVRGSVSIGRRLMDPLAELVKIDSKSIGVGQYQHDVDQNLLKQSLDDCVESCVNSVGVELNTASKQLLTYVSGLGAVRADAIIRYRNQKGAFKSREELKNVPGLGPKAYEQAAGFLRINDGANVLDGSAVHPESYGIVYAMCKDLKCEVLDLMKSPTLIKSIDLKKYETDEIGVLTLQDIKEELVKPGRDPRAPFQLFEFKEGVEKMEDLEVGMELPGVITNVTAFGAFCDIGVHQDGLIHISQLSDRFVKDPNEVVKVHQKVKVRVLEIDLDRKRIALSAKSNR